MPDASSKNSDFITRAYSLLTGDEDARVCRDISEEACREQPGNFFRHILAFSSTKIGDSLASAKLVLPWLLSMLGAPAFMVGLVVPIREAGSLIPQLIVAGFIRPYPVRKWFWVGGSMGQGLAVLGMAITALLLEGAAAGWLIVGLLALFALARGVASISSKDVLGKTISKGRRGAVSGYASAVAGIAAVGVGAYLSAVRQEPQPESFFFAILLAAAALWLFASMIFAGLKEQPGATKGGGSAFRKAVESLSLLTTDKIFRHFVITRALLLSTALSMPYYVVLANERTEASLTGLGLLFVAGGLGEAISAPIWGKLADRSSRIVIIAAAGITALLGATVFLLLQFEGVDVTGKYGFAVVYLVMGIAHGGARLGRKTYLVDMATQDKRAAYVAISNTAIGVLLLVGGAFGAVAQLFGNSVVILSLAVVAAIAAISAIKLPEVE